MKYFVLKPKGDGPHAIAAREAMRAYANSIAPTHPVMAKELRDWILREAFDADQ